MSNNDKNERVLPPADKTIKPEVTASPVDTTIHYQVNPLKSVNRQATLDFLSNIGQGIVSVDKQLQNTASEQAFDLHQKTEGKTNKENWAAASKNLEGMAKFNPYVKDEYKKLVAQDLQREAELTLVSNPNAYKMPTADFEQFITDTKNTMYQKFDALGLNVSHYKDSAELFEKTLQTARRNYVENNARYNYENMMKQQAYSFTVNAVNACLIEADDTSKSEAVKNAVLSLENTCNSLGIPDTDAALILQKGLTNLIAKNPDLMTSAAYLEAVSDITINGKPIGELLPDFTSNLNELIRTSKRNAYNDKALELQTKQLEYAKTADEASKAFLNWINENKNATGDQIENAVRDIETKYPLSGSDGFSLYSQASSIYRAFKTLHEEDRDDEAENAIWLAYMEGSLTNTDLKNAVRAGVIKGNTAYSIMKNMENEGKVNPNSNVKQIQQYITKQLDLYSPDNNDSPITDTTLRKETLNQLQGYLRELLELDITPERARAIYDEVKVNIPKRAALQNSMHQLTQNGGLFVNGVFLKAQPVLTSSREENQEALNRLGIVQQSVITSNYGKRTINGKEGVHRNIDVVSKNNVTAVFTPKTGGSFKVLDKGYLPDCGRYVTLKHSSGAVIRYIHLKTFGNYKIGTTIKANRRLGTYGSLDKGVTGAHLDVSFYKPANNKWGYSNCTPAQYEALLK